MPQKSPHTVVLSKEQRRALERRAAAYSGPYRDVMRAKAILLAAEGLANTGSQTSFSASTTEIADWRRVLAGQPGEKGSRIRRGAWPAALAGPEILLGEIQGTADRPATPPIRVVARATQGTESTCSSPVTSNSLARSDSEVTTDTLPWLITGTQRCGT
jgi:hypothetical protein